MFLLLLACTLLLAAATIVAGAAGTRAGGCVPLPRFERLPRTNPGLSDLLLRLVVFGPELLAVVEGQLFPRGNIAPSVERNAVIAVDTVDLLPRLV